jgi:hypothetical protein
VGTDATVVRLHVDHLPGDRDPKPLWSSTTSATDSEIDRCWQWFPRRFDLEHTFLLRLFKQTLGWTAPKIRTPQAVDRRTWLIIAAHTQLR